jgi:hypothetical protein
MTQVCQHSTGGSLIDVCLDDPGLCLRRRRSKTRRRSLLDGDRRSSFWLEIRGIVMIYDYQKMYWIFSKKLREIQAYLLFDIALVEESRLEAARLS